MLNINYLRPSDSSKQMMVKSRAFCKEMRSEGFLDNSGGLEVGGVFTHRCSSDRSRPQQFAMRSLSLTVGRRSEDVTKSFVEANVVANSMALVRFAACFMIAFALCVAGAILS